MTHSVLSPRSSVFALCLAAGLAVACGGAQAPADPPPPAPSALPASKAPEAPEAKPEQAAPEAAPDEPAPAEPTAFKPDRPPKEILTTEDTTFAFKFTSSDVGIAAEKTCREQGAGNPKAEVDCNREVRDKFPVQILYFVQKQGSWWWVTYERRGNQLIVLHKIAFQWGEETDNTVTILPAGKDQGLAPMSPVPQKVVITIPNDYSISLQDREHGTMVYTATIGLLPGAKK